MGSANYTELATCGSNHICHKSMDMLEAVRVTADVDRYTGDLLVEVSRSLRTFPSKALGQNCQLELIEITQRSPSRCNLRAADTWLFRISTYGIDKLYRWRFMVKKVQTELLAACVCWLRTRYGTYCT